LGDGQLLNQIFIYVKKKFHQLLESSLRGGGMPGGGSPAGPDTPPGEEAIAGVSDTGKKAM